jgi:hypothetical protein
MAWLDGKRVEALWCNDQRSNVHGWIDGSWRKFQDAHDDACTNSAVLAAHAKDGSRTVDVRVEGGAVKEMYVW